MAKKKLETDFPMFDSDLDFNFDDEIGQGINQEASSSPKKRSVVTNVLAGAKSGITDTVKDPSFIKSTLRKILPDTYGEIATGTQELATGIHTLYDQPIRELKPRINSIMKKVDTLVPEGQKTLKSLSNKIQDWSGGRDYANSSSAENQDEQAVTSMLGAIFQQNKTYTDIAQRKEILKDVTEKKRFSASTGIMDEIRQNTSIQAQYTTNVTQAYQRKMLELTLRSYLVQRENLAVAKDFSKVAKVQYDAIIKNTSLPEFLKITKSEAFMEAGRRNVINALYGDGSKLQKGINKLKGSVMEMASGVAMTLDNVDMGLDQAMSAREAIEMQNETLTSMGLPPLTKAEMAGAMAAGNAVEWLRDKIAKPLKEKLAKNKGLTEKLGTVSRHMMNPAGYIAKLRSGDDWERNKSADGPKGMGYRFMDFIMEHFTDDSPSQTFKNQFDTNKLNGPAMGFDNKAHLSLTEVIPGHLAAIHREIRILRTNDESTPFQTYDFQRREFVTQKTLGARMMAGMKTEAKNSQSRRAIDEAAESFEGDVVLNDEEKVELRLFFSRIARIGNMEITSENIKNTSAYEKLSFRVKALVDSKLEEIDSSEDKEAKLSGLTKKVTTIRSGFPSMEGYLGNQVNAGYGDILADQKVTFKDSNGDMQSRGVIRRTDDGDFIRDEEAFNAFLEQNGITKPEPTTATSDINAKQAIKEMKPRELLESFSQRFKKSLSKLSQRNDPDFTGPHQPSFLDKAKKWNPQEAYDGIKKTKLFNWKYKPGEGDGESHDGPMAQEVNKNLGEESAPGGKKIDLVSLNGAAMAAVKHLGDKVESIRKSDKLKEAVDTMKGFKDSLVSKLEEIGNRPSKNKDTDDFVGPEKHVSMMTVKELLIKIQKDTAVIAKQSGGFGLPNFNGVDIDTDKIKSTAKAGFNTARQSFGKGIKHTLVGFEKLLGGDKARSGIGTGDVDQLTDEDLLNIRILQSLMSASGWKKQAAQMFFAKYPQYLEADTSDAAIEAAKTNPNAGANKSPDERTAMSILGSVVFQLGKKVGNLGASVFNTGSELFGFAKNKIATPIWNEAVPMFKKALGKISEAVGSAKEIGSRLSADDLMTIREMKELLKSKGKKAKETAQSYFARFPQYMDIDTSDEAIEQAKQDPSAGSQKTNEERSILSMAAGIVSTVGGKVFDFGTNIVKNIIPSSLQSLKTFAAKTLGEIGKQVNPIRDLYIPGHKRPSIRATKLSKGDYKDSSTNKPLFSIEDVIRCKGDIVNEKGNVVVGIEELQAGLVDRSGQLVKSNMMTAVAGVVGAGFAMKDRLIGNLKYLKETGSKVFGKIKDKITGKFSGEPGSDGSFGFGSSSKYLKDGYQVWVDIRSIMLGQGGEVRKRLKLEASGDGKGSSSSTQTTESTSGESTDSNSSTSAIGKIGNAAGKALGIDTDKARDRINSAKDKLGEWKSKITGSRLGQKTGNYIDRLKSSKLGTKVQGIAGSRAGQVVGKGLGAIKSVGTGIVGGIGTLASTFMGGGDKAAETPQDAANDPNRAKELAEKAKPGEKVVKTKIAEKDRAKDDKDGDGDKDGSVEDRKEHLEALKASRQKEGAQADLTARWTSGGLFEGISGKIMSMIGMVTSGLSSMFSLGGTILSKIPALGKGIQSAGKFLKPVASFAGKAAWQASKFIGRNVLRAGAVAAVQVLPAVASAAVGVIGSALTAIGAVLASPYVIGAAAVAATAYIGYKTYKYFTKNNANEYDRIRLRQYGVGDNSAYEQYNNHFFALEQYLLDGKVGYNTGKAYIIDRNVKPEDIAEIFKVDKEDTEHGQAVGKWYSERFKPFFLTHLTALQSANNKGKLDSIDSLKPNEKVKYLEGVGFESGPYDVTTSPLKGIETLSTESKPVLEAIKVLIENASKEVKKDGKAISLPVKSGGSDITNHRTDVVEADYNEKIRQQKKLADEKAASIKASDAREAKMLPQSAKEKATGQGEGEGPSPDVPKQLLPENKTTASSGSIPMAAGAPVSSEGGEQYLKLGKGVDIANLNGPTRNMLLSMAKEYGTLTGKSIQVNSGKRSYEAQAALHAKDPNGAAAPGRSLHEYGLAVDINSADANELEKLGLMKKYGFTRPVGGEPWHMEPAGIQKNIELARKDPSAADTMALASFRRGGGGVGTDPSAQKYRRNTELAVSLLNNPGVTAKETITAQTTDGAKTADATSAPLNGVAIPAPTAASVSSGLQGQPAANDAQKDGKVIKVNFKPGTSANSTNQNLPTPASIDNRGTEGETNTSTPVSKDDKNGGIKNAIIENTKKAGGDPNLMLSFAAVESSMNPAAKAKGSSAAGLFQFTKSTWDEQLGKHGNKYGLSPNASPFDVDASTILATEYVKSNLNAIKAVKPNPTVTDAYLTHFLGAGGAKKFLSQDMNAIAANVLPEAAASNPAIFGTNKTIGTVYNDVNTRVSQKAKSVGVTATTAPMAGTSTPAAAPSEPILNQPGTEGGTSTAAGIAPKTESATPAATEKAQREMISPSTNSGVFVDKRGSSQVARERREAGESFSGPNMMNIESALDKSLGIQKDQLDVLRGILENVSPEKLGKILADAVTSASQSASNQDTMKQKDDKNMGRKDMAPRSSVDFSRKVM